MLPGPDGGCAVEARCSQSSRLWPGLQMFKSKYARDATAQWTEKKGPGWRDQRFLVHVPTGQRVFIGLKETNPNIRLLFLWLISVCLNNELVKPLRKFQTPSVWGRTVTVCVTSTENTARNQALPFVFPCLDATWLSLQSKREQEHCEMTWKFDRKFTLVDHNKAGTKCSFWSAENKRLVLPREEPKPQKL